MKYNTGWYRCCVCDTSEVILHMLNAMMQQHLFSTEAVVTWRYGTCHLVTIFGTTISSCHFCQVNWTALEISCMWMKSTEAPSFLMSVLTNWLTAFLLGNVMNTRRSRPILDENVYTSFVSRRFSGHTNISYLHHSKEIDNITKRQKAILICGNGKCPYRVAQYHIVKHFRFIAHRNNRLMISHMICPGIFIFG